MGTIKGILKVISAIMSFLVLCLPYTPLTEGVLNSLSVDTTSYVDFSSEAVTNLLLKTGNGFDEGTNDIAVKIVSSVIVQFMTGDTGENSIKNALAELTFEDKQRDNPEQYASENALSDAVSNALTSSSILPDNIKSFITQYANGINDLYVYFRTTDYDGVYEFMGSYVDNKGNVVSVTTGVYYDSSTGSVYGKDNNGIFGIGYDFDADDYVVYNPSNVWMKDLGYNIVYDIVGEATFMDCDYKRIKFNYDNTDRMVQLWKGNYTPLSNGAEIGLYYLEEGRFIQYTCACDESSQLTMSMELFDGDKLILSREPITQWWLTGFKVAPAIDKEDMSLRGSIDFKGSEYADAFLAAAQAETDMTVRKTNSSTVSFVWQ